MKIKISEENIKALGNAMIEAESGDDIKITVDYYFAGFKFLGTIYRKKVTFQVKD